MTAPTDSLTTMEGIAADLLHEMKELKALVREFLTYCPDYKPGDDEYNSIFAKVSDAVEDDE